MSPRPRWPGYAVQQERQQGRSHWSLPSCSMQSVSKWRTASRYRPTCNFGRYVEAFCICTSLTDSCRFVKWSNQYNSADLPLRAGPKWHPLPQSQYLPQWDSQERGASLSKRLCHHRKMGQGGPRACLLCLCRCTLGQVREETTLFTANYWIHHWSLLLHHQLCLHQVLFTVL